VAKSLGCAWVEFDVRLSADGGLVVCHDDKLDRTTDGHGRISKMPLSTIREVDAGRWFGPGFTGERAPTLTETLILCREIGLGANVEIKAERGRGPATAAAVADCLDEVEPQPRILISSFLSEAVGEAAVLMPSVPRGMLWRKIPHGWHRMAKGMGCATIHCGHASLTEEVADEVRAAGYPLLAYTVNDAARARQLFSWGIASVFSDAPDIILQAMADDLAAGQRGTTL
jgi:glycerophosphoryl diester phosphodiesterase